MIVRKILATSAISAALLLSVPAMAETLRIGATITDPQGGEVGTITALDSQYVTVRTDRHTTRLPVTSFTPTDETVLFALTRAQLNAQLDQALAQAQAAIDVGAIVHGRDGAVIGPIEAVDAQYATVKVGEQQIRMPRSSIAQGPNGLVAGYTLAQLQAQLGATATATTTTTEGTN